MGCVVSTISGVKQCMGEEKAQTILFSTEPKIHEVSWGEDPEIDSFYSALAHWAKVLQCQ